MAEAEEKETRSNEESTDESEHLELRVTFDEVLKIDNEVI